MDNAYMFNVASKTIKYQSGKNIMNQHYGDMDGQSTFRELTEDATRGTVCQINESKLELGLCSMDASPDKWSKSLENFLDTWEIKLAQLNDSRDVAVPDKEKKDWLTPSLRGHPMAMASIHQQQELELASKANFSDTTGVYVPRTFLAFMNGIAKTMITKTNV
jgi:hypothetical protein